MVWETFMCGLPVTVVKKTIATVMATLHLCGQYPSTVPLMMDRTRTTTRAVPARLLPLSVMVPKIPTLEWWDYFTITLTLHAKTLSEHDRMYKLRNISNSYSRYKEKYLALITQVHKIKKYLYWVYDICFPVHFLPLSPV